MRTLNCKLALSLLSVACATTGARPPEDARTVVDRAAAALGGAGRVARLSTVVVKGTARHWEPEQSVQAGGEMRLAGDSTFTVLRDLPGGAARIEWVRKLVYPGPREYRFVEVVTDAGGYVEGNDSASVVARSTKTQPPAHVMSNVRLAAERRELLRTSPKLVVDMLGRAAKVTRVEPIEAGGQRLEAVQYEVSPDVRFIVGFDAATGLPARIRTLDADAVQGDSTYDLVLGDWREVGGVKFAFRQSYELNGREVVRMDLLDVAPGAPIDPTALEAPLDLKLAGWSPPPTVPYQWVLRRQFYGLYLDTDEVNFDPGASPGLGLVDLARGVSQVVGGTHNSLVIEMADHLIVLDAPVNEWQSRWTMDAARKRYPGKPIRFLVLSHHHVDHIGGARAYVAEGATVVAARDDHEHLARMFAAPHRIDGDALQRKPRRAEIVDVADRHLLTDGSRTVELLRIDNPHVQGMLIAYVPDVRIGFVVDLWSPGRDKLGDKLNPGQAALVAAVQRAGWSPERFAGGHGTSGSFAELAMLAGR